MDDIEEAEFQRQMDDDIGGGGGKTSAGDDGDIHAKNVWCCGDGYFDQKNLRKKCVNRDKSA